MILLRLNFIFGFSFSGSFYPLPLLAASNYFLKASYKLKAICRNELLKNILSINGVTGIFLGADFLSVNKKEEINWEDVKHIIISLINDLIFFVNLKMSSNILSFKVSISRFLILFSSLIFFL